MITSVTEQASDFSSGVIVIDCKVSPWFNLVRRSLTYRTTSVLDRKN